MLNAAKAEVSTDLFVALCLENTAFFADAADRICVDLIQLHEYRAL